MGKKIHARDLREQRKNDRTAKFADQNKKCEAQRAVQKKDAAVSVKSASSVSSKKDNATKSMAKAAGVKSVFAVGRNTVYMTSFGRGNDAVLEQKIVDTSHEPLNIDDPAYQLNVVTMNGYSVTGHRGETVSAVTDNPLRRFNGGKKDEPEQSVPTDMLCLKPTLEKKFFGKEFDDNIHIQLIYNILDIEKILAVYSTNAVYALNNTIADESNENWDLFANFSTDNTYDELINAATYKESADDESTDDEKRREAEKKKREAKKAEKSWLIMKNSERITGWLILPMHFMLIKTNQKANPKIKQKAFSVKKKKFILYLL